MHLEFLVEDSSGSKLLEILIPKVIGASGCPHTWRVHAYKGIGKVPKGFQPTTEARKRILLDQLPKILSGYAKTPGIDAIIVVVDSDGNNCSRFLAELQAVAAASGCTNTLFRIAIEEIEAWYLGDPQAIQAAYPRAKMQHLATYVQDSVAQTWELLADMVYGGGRRAVSKQGWPLPGQLKHEWAEQIGQRLDLGRNCSPSFKKFVSGVRSVVGVQTGVEP